MSWSAMQYSKYEAERNRPIIDLLANMPLENVGNAVDIGCGPGNSTELLLKRYPAARITGMDSSENMITAARRRLPEVDFQVADIASWQPEELPDVILANAVLQWLPGHETLLPALINKLAPGGSLAIQMPDNLGEPAHVLMREIAARGRRAEKLLHADTRVSRHNAAWYYETLRECAKKVDVWRTTYHHVLNEGTAAIVEWFKGSGLRPFLDALDEAEQTEFIQEYEEALSTAYTVYADGTVLLPFPRLFIVATK